MAHCWPLWVTCALALTGGTVEAQTCFEILADSFLPAIFDLPLFQPSSSIVKRQVDGRVFSLTLSPFVNFVEGEPLNTQGFVCCHTGTTPKLFAGDGTSDVFAATYFAGLDCTGPNGEKLAFSPGLLSDIELISEAVEARAASAVPTLGGVCGEQNSSDCSLEFSNAEQNSQFSGLCSRCVSEAGNEPFRIRCRSCCEECPQRATCFAVPAEVPGPAAPSGLPLPVPLAQFDFSEPVTLFSVVVVVPGGRTLMVTPTNAPEPLRAGPCCSEGALPKPRGAPAAPDTSQSFGERVIAQRSSCSGQPLQIVDPSVSAKFLR